MFMCVWWVFLGRMVIECLNEMYCVREGLYLGFNRYLFI